MSLLRFTLAVLVATALLGCGGHNPTSTAKADTTLEAICANCTGSDSSGATCETVLDTSTTAKVALPEIAKPELVEKAETRPQKPEPNKIVERPRELPKMWDFGSEKCIPCKTMLEILTPMMASYKGKVDIRIINVYEEKELAKQFRISVIPTQVFIDAEGKELFRHIGVYPRDSIEAKFREFAMPIVTGAVMPVPASECLT
jgi:thiol-disulfide isomerase/thioredoxin